MKKGIFISITILAFSILCFIYALNTYNSKMNFIKPSFDESAISGIPKVSKNLEYKQLDAEGLYSVSLCGKPTIENDKLKLYLTSAEDNNIYLKVRILKDEKIVGESGLIKPGEYIENVKVKNVQKDDSVTLKIMGYEMDSYYSAGVITIDLDVR